MSRFAASIPFYTVRQVALLSIVSTLAARVAERRCSNAAAAARLHERTHRGQKPLRRFGQRIVHRRNQGHPIHASLVHLCDEAIQLQHPGFKVGVAVDDHCASERRQLPSNNMSSLTIRAFFVFRCLVPLTICAILLASRNAAAQETALPKEGLFSWGIGVIPLGLGPIQVFSAGGHAFGLRLSAGAQIDLGPRWALRLPLVIAGASGGSLDGYAEIDVVPGVIYRFRDRVDEPFTPYLILGGGIKLGGFGAGRPLLAKPVVVATLRPLVSRHDLFEGHHHSDDPNFDSNAAIGAEVWVGLSWHATRLLSLDFELAGSIVPVDGVPVEVLAETAALRFMF